MERPMLVALGRTKHLHLVATIAAISALSLPSTGQVSALSEDAVTIIEGAPPPVDASLINQSDFKLRHAAAALVDDNKDDFAGTYVDKGGVVVLVATSERGEVLGRELVGGRLDARLDSAATSLNKAVTDVSRVALSSPSFADGFSYARMDPESNTVEIVATSSPSIDEVATFADVADQLAIAITIYADPAAPRFGLADSRQEEVSSYAGGARYVRVEGNTSADLSHGFCSTGFGYIIGTTEYVLTAGHCFQTNEPSIRYMWTAQLAGTGYVKNVYAGVRQSGDTSWNGSQGTIQGGLDNGWHGDLSIVNVSAAGKEAGQQVWWDGPTSPSKIPVTERIPPDIGDPTCFSGHVSGADCGTSIQTTNALVTLGGQPGKWMDIATSSSAADCPVKGDSGAPVVYNHSGSETQATAIGIVGGFDSTSGCSMLFTGAEEAIQRWGGKVRGSG